MFSTVSFTSERLVSLYSLTPSNRPHFLCKWTRVLGIAIQNLHPRIVPTPKSCKTQQPHHVSIRRDRRLHHRIHGHRVDEILHMMLSEETNRQHVDFLFRRHLRDLLLVLLVRVELSSLVLPDQGAVATSITKLENQFSILVKRVVLVLNLSFLDQLPIEVAALVADATRNVHRKDAPLSCQSSASPT